MLLEFPGDEPRAVYTNPIGWFPVALFRESLSDAFEVGDDRVFDFIFVRVEVYREIDC